MIELAKQYQDVEKCLSVLLRNDINMGNSDVYVSLVAQRSKLEKELLNERRIERYNYLINTTK